MFAIWGGIAGIQHGLPLLLDRGVDVSAKISANVARRFRLGGKGGGRPDMAQGGGSDVAGLAEVLKAVPEWVEGQMS